MSLTHSKNCPIHRSRALDPAGMLQIGLGCWLRAARGGVITWKQSFMVRYWNKGCLSCWSFILLSLTVMQKQISPSIVSANTVNLAHRYSGEAVGVKLVQHCPCLSSASNWQDVRVRNPPTANIALGQGNHKVYEKRSCSGNSCSPSSANGMSVIMKGHVNRHLPAYLMNMKDELNVVELVMIPRLRRKRSGGETNMFGFSNGLFLCLKPVSTNKKSPVSPCSVLIK